MGYTQTDLVSLAYICLYYRPTCVLCRCTVLPTRDAMLARYYLSLGVCVCKRLRSVEMVGRIKLIFDIDASLDLSYTAF